jgi:HAD superfamily hydrolase (TIGR01509 family)
MNKKPLIIFDCDGVLLDSEIISLAVNAEMLTKLGLPHTIEQVRERFLGVTADAFNALIESDLGGPIPEWFEYASQNRLEEEFKQSLRATHGILDILGDFPYPICVASNSRLTRLQSTLTQTKLYSHFYPYIYSSQMVAKGKPAPDLFLYAANNMGFDVHDCIVIEDSVNGVKAAIAADMLCFGFVGGSHCVSGHENELSSAGAKTIFSNMYDLPELIEEFCDI